ncbi:NACHT domain-containing protein [Streptomyces iakyrus]|uniref:NACHT domain-containing protein n=1 Tax=Streptomyces iakyrus TaxID=68219 RepID=UPI003678C979
MGASRTGRVAVIYFVLQATAAVLALWLSKQFQVARLAATAITLAPTVPVAYLAWEAYRADRAEAAADTDAKAKTLATAVRGAEKQQREQLIGDGGHRIDLTFTHQREPNNATGARPRGQLTDIVAYYKNLQPARLVITGAPGAGKTLLAVELILGLARPDRADTDLVPVRCSLPNWDTDRPLHEWVAGQIHEQFRATGLSLADTRRLVQEHRILPILDGLDEMDSAATPPGRRRTARALQQLNAYQDHSGSAPIVLTCRTAQYTELAALDMRIREAARIEIDPVAPAQATAYLTARTESPARWTSILNELTTAPDSTLAHALSTPWRLNLAATAYEERHPETMRHIREPDDLLDLDSDSPSAVRDHLLALYLPAAIRQHPTRPDRYSADQAHRWLAALAHHLATTPASTRTSTDIVLHQLWPMADPRRVRIADALLTVLLALFTFAALFMALLLAQLPGSDLFVSLAVLMALPWLMAVRTASRAAVPTPRKAHLHQLRRPAHFRRLTGYLMVGLTFGLTLGLVSGRASGLEDGFAAGLVAGLLAGLGTLPKPLTSDVAPTDPRSSVRDDLVVGLTTGLAASLVIGLSFVLAFWLTIDLAAGLAVALGPGLAFGLSYGLAGGLYLLTGAGRRYVVFLCCSRGQLPHRLGGFLHWAYGAGLLRISGLAYQFRHQELQDWLAAHPHR